MAKCVMEHCEQEGGRLKINFHSEGDHYYARVSMCLDCYYMLKSVKGNTGKSAQCDVLFSVVGSLVDDEGVNRLAHVQSMRFNG